MVAVMPRVTVVFSTLAALAPAKPTVSATREQAVSASTIHLDLDITLTAPLVDWPCLNTAD